MAMDLESENCSVQTLNRLLKMPISFFFLISSWMLVIFKAYGFVNNWPRNICKWVFSFNQSPQQCVLCCSIIKGRWLHEYSWWEDYMKNMKFLYFSWYSSEGEVGILGFLLGPQNLIDNCESVCQIMNQCINVHLSVDGGHSCHQILQVAWHISP